GEVMVAALPGSLRLASETRILLNPEFSEADRLNDREYLVFQALELNNYLSLSDISAMLEIKVVYPVIKSMLEKGCVMVEEELREKFKPKTTDYIQLHSKLSGESAMHQAFDALEKAPKQLEMLMAFIHLK